jgi:hypothetical protein
MRACPNGLALAQGVREENPDPSKAAPPDRRSGSERCGVGAGDSGESETRGNTGPFKP